MATGSSSKAVKAVDAKTVKDVKSVKSVKSVASVKSVKSIGGGTAKAVAPAATKSVAATPPNATPVAKKSYNNELLGALQDIARAVAAAISVVQKNS